MRGACFCLGSRQERNAVPERDNAGAFEGLPMTQGFSAGADGVLLPDMGSVCETRLRRAAQWK